MTIGTIFYVIAIIMFVIASLGVPTGRISLLPLGLAFLTLGLMLGGVVLLR